MTNTDLFYKIIKDYRKGIEEINAHFKPEYERISAFRDSEFYPSRKQEIDRRRGERIAGLRAQKMDSLGACISMMSRNYLNRPMSAPSDEQLRLLSALQMRESLSADEIRQASVSLEGCPAATGVLRELARKNHCSLDVQQELSGTEIQKGIENLRRSAEAFLDKVDRLDDEARRDLLNTQGRYDLFLMSGENSVSNKTECLRIFGHITDADGFAAAVDGVSC